MGTIMSHPQYDAEQLIAEHGSEDALYYAKDILDACKPLTPEYYQALAVWCYIRGYIEGQASHD